MNVMATLFCTILSYPCFTWTIFSMSKTHSLSQPLSTWPSTISEIQYYTLLFTLLVLPFQVYVTFQDLLLLNEIDMMNTKCRTIQCCLGVLVYGTINIKHIWTGDVYLTFKSDIKLKGRQISLFSKLYSLQYFVGYWRLWGPIYIFFFG